MSEVVARCRARVEEAEARAEKYRKLWKEREVVATAVERWQQRRR